MTKRQPWYKEGRRPQRIETCSECGRRFRDKRLAEEALLQAIFGEMMCPECRRKRDFVTCTTCNEPVEKGKAIHYEDLPYHYFCLPTTNLYNPSIYQTPREPMVD